MNCPLFISLMVAGILSCFAQPASQQSVVLTKIGFGSCINTNEHPMLDKVAAMSFDLFILLGDNIYADTVDMGVMQQKYDALKQSQFYQGLRKKCPILATWDDHDFGANDAGGNYPKKVESQKLFYDFLDEPADSPKRKREGVYDAYLFGPSGKRVQVILLDTRYFRSSLANGDNGVTPSGGSYIPNNERSATFLGEVQWIWLEEQLRTPAEIRVIASSIQFLSEFSGAEAWANMPHEKQRMLELIDRTNAKGVVFLSGDRHWAELSRIDRNGSYPIYDVTSSALTQRHKRGTPTPNKFREGPTYHDANVGLMTIEWKKDAADIMLQVLDIEGNARIEKRFSSQF